MAASRTGSAGAPAHSHADGRAWHVDEEATTGALSVYRGRARTIGANAGAGVSGRRRSAGFSKCWQPAGAAIARYDSGLSHSPKRFKALEQAIDADVAGRAILAKQEIDFAMTRRSITGVLLDANLPERVTHNDTKFNNVLLDDDSGEAICVIDLDTVMPDWRLTILVTWCARDESGDGRRAGSFEGDDAVSDVRSAGSRLFELGRRIPDQGGKGSPCLLGKSITFELGFVS